MTKPFITKTGRAWIVHINGRPYAATRTHAEAIRHADAVATYAHRIRFKRDIDRIKAALTRMESP